MQAGGLELIAGAPWPIGFVLGLVGFLAIRYGIALALSGTGNPYLAPTAELLRGGALVGLAWLFLGVCWFGALMSFVRQRFSSSSATAKKPPAKRSTRRRGNAPSSAYRREAPWVFVDESSRTPTHAASSQSNEPAPVTPENIANLSWLQFEQLIAASFRRKGFSAELTAEGADEGIDIVLRERDNMLLVQCKHWAAVSVGVNVARELFGVMHAKGARKAILATSGRLTPDARRFCNDNAIHCIDAGSLYSFVDPSAMPPQHEIASDRRDLCPLCGAAMVLRRGRQSGRRFRGCSRYPACKGKRFAGVADG
ncbi:restriction endonuclease [Salinisphaera sp. RV14]|uniref:restriction endonuclease n=1 Tax=Salinisphaera sp. RV14 TaxID=3454140 RepID=UPI003F8747E8